jgi:hypothetical protein
VSTGIESIDGAQEEAAYTLGVQTYLWGVPLTEYGKTAIAGIQAGAVRVQHVPQIRRSEDGKRPLRRDSAQRHDRRVRHRRPRCGAGSY